MLEREGFTRSTVDSEWDKTLLQIASSSVLIRQTTSDSCTETNENPEPSCALPTLHPHLVIKEVTDSVITIPRMKHPLRGFDATSDITPRFFETLTATEHFPMKVLVSFALFKSSRRNGSRAASRNLVCCHLPGDFAHAMIKPYLQNPGLGR